MRFRNMKYYIIVWRSQWRFYGSNPINALQLEDTHASKYVVGWRDKMRGWRRIGQTLPGPGLYGFTEVLMNPKTIIKQPLLVKKISRRTARMY